MNKNKDNKEIINTLKKATSNNKTKNQIIDLVKSGIELIKSKEAETFNPKEIEEKKKKEVFIVETEKLVSPESKEMDFIKIFDEVSEKMLKYKEDINIKLEEGREKYKIIHEAILAKEERLNELYSLDVELMNIAGIMASKDALLEKNKIETQKKIQEYEDKLDEAKKKHEEFVAEHNKQSENYIKEREESRKREEEDYNYKTKKEREIENDKWERRMDEESYEFKIKVKKQEDVLNEKKLELNKEIEEFKKKEDEYQSLKDKVASIPNLIEEAVNKAVEKAAEKEKKTAQFQKTIVEKSHEGKVNLLEAENKSKDNQIIELNKKVDSLEKKLDEAYKEIKEMASKTLDSSSSQKYATQLEKQLDNTLSKIESSKNNSK